MLVILFGLLRLNLDISLMLKQRQKSLDLMLRAMRMKQIVQKSKQETQRVRWCVRADQVTLRDRFIKQLSNIDSEAIDGVIQGIQLVKVPKKRLIRIETEAGYFLYNSIMVSDQEEECDQIFLYESLIRENKLLKTSN
ncbi:UNKNOWN [Stylonychia lemnae]|uniref:Uncharacterized protein n=1 Tax=Stylonychia lemnae TaxID=5949 RepID=A0A077ZWM3_STYLE|nr:UNKNOWN [Stylonychia lemnae]|eukprot:CDW73986.1 UNKNOWN [Stylonychia lemnae]